MSFHTHVRRFGQGVRQALAIHCTLAHSGAWRGLGDELGERVTLIAIDLPGHGRSEDWDGQSDLHARCTAAALRHLRAPMDVIGHSFGATVALRLAVEHPGSVRSLTLIEPVFFAVAIADAPDEVVRHDIEAEPYFTALKQGDTALAARLFNRFWGDGTRWDDIPQSTQRYMADRMHIVPDQAAAISEDNAGLLAPGALHRVTMPTLFIQGDQSPDIINTITTSLCSRLPNARRALIKGAGHMSPVTHPREVAAALRRLFEVAQE